MAIKVQRISGILGLFYSPIVMLLPVTPVEVYVDALAKEDGELIGAAFSSRSNSAGTE